MNDRFAPNPGIAAILSFVIPGVGQFYNGKFLRGVFWLIVTPGLWLGSAGTLGWNLPHHRGLHRLQLRREAPPA